MATTPGATTIKEKALDKAAVLNSLRLTRKLAFKQPNELLKVIL